MAAGGQRAAGDRHGIGNGDKRAMGVRMGAAFAWAASKAGIGVWIATIPQIYRRVPKKRMFRSDERKKEATSLKARMLLASY